MRLQLYLDRINYDGVVEPIFATLAALQEAHVCSVPLENLDVQGVVGLWPRTAARHEELFGNDSFF